MEGYLKAADNANWRYGGIAIHPYGNIDGGSLSMHDLDEETGRLLEQMSRFGYGSETPIFYTEMFNIPETYLPEWNADRSYDEYSAGKATYDFGNREFIHAASAARAIIIMAKYWPQLRSANLWMARPFMDMRLTPLMLCKAINTIGTLMDDVRHVADVKPSPRIRGYVFERGDASALAAVWCIDRDVENGLRRGPRIRVAMRQNVEFRDFMGNTRQPPEPRAGRMEIPLNPAPLFIVATDARKLAADLLEMEHDDVTAPIQLAILPKPGGGLECTLKNRTGRRQTGRVVIGRQVEPYALAAGLESSVDVQSAPADAKPGEMYQWSETARLEPDSGDPVESPMETRFFLVPRINRDHDWDLVPTLPLSQPFGKARDGLEAKVRVAWDANDVLIRLHVRDPDAASTPSQSRDKRLVHSSARASERIEIYLDTAANGRTTDTGALDADDYRYEITLPEGLASGRAIVNRVRGVYHQLADGTNMPSPKDVADTMPCDFERVPLGYQLTLSLEQKFILPLTIRSGSRFGLGIIVHSALNTDRINDPDTGVALGYGKTLPALRTPASWPIAILEP
jgi:hypothetical protein